MFLFWLSHLPTSHCRISRLLISTFLNSEGHRVTGTLRQTLLPPASVQALSAWFPLACWSCLMSHISCLTLALSAWFPSSASPGASLLRTLNHAGIRVRGGISDCYLCWGPVCRNGFDMIQSQPLSSSFKLIISFTFSSLMFKSSDSERLDKFSGVLVEF